MKNDAQVFPHPEESLGCSAREIPRSGGVVDFERLYQMHGRRVYRLCWHMLWDKAEAEDLTQEVFLQVFRKIDTFRGEAAFTTWLHCLTVNVVLMRLRKKSRIEPSLGEGVERGEQPDYARQELADPDTVLTSANDRLDLEHALAQLPAGHRMVFVLHDVVGYGHEEIARMSGVEAGTSKSQLHKARLRLRDLLRGAGSRLPQAEVGRMSRNVARKPRMRGRASKGRPFRLTAAGASFGKMLANGRCEMHPEGNSPPTGPGSDLRKSSMWR